MVHNGIEIRHDQAYAEGFDIFKNATNKDLPKISATNSTCRILRGLRGGTW